MKYYILLFLITYTSYSQKAIYNKIYSQSNYTEYQTKDNHTLNIGDTLIIGYPRIGNAFTFITQGGEMTASYLSNSKITIHKIKTLGNSKRGYKTYIIFNTYGLIPVYIDYESAIETGELKIL
jgi:lactate dehydrogenase-like 2-hydroxyacid dehydrogenase